jgi:hypothetical protein
VALSGNVALFVSLILLALQVREMTKQSALATRSTIAAVYQQMNDNMLDIDRLFVERPELRPFFYGDAVLPADAEPVDRERLVAMAELIVDLMDNVVTQLPILPARLAQPWQDFFRGLVSGSPTLTEFWKAWRHLYSIDLRNLLDASDDDRPSLPGARAR